jgi:hypothetical protein
VSLARLRGGEPEHACSPSVAGSRAPGKALGAVWRWPLPGERGFPLSCDLFRSNEVRLSLSLIAYKLGNLWRGAPSEPGAAEADRRLVRDQLAAAVVREHGAPDRGGGRVGPFLGRRSSSG